MLAKGQVCLHVLVIPNLFSSGNASEICHSRGFFERIRLGFVFGGNHRGRQTKIAILRPPSPVCLFFWSDLYKVLFLALLFRKS